MWVHPLDEPKQQIRTPEEHQSIKTEKHLLVHLLVLKGAKINKKKHICTVSFRQSPPAAMHISLAWTNAHFQSDASSPASEGRRAMRS